MKNSFLSLIILTICLFSFHVYAQTEKDSTLLGLPGDNLDLYAALNLFQKSPTIEDFEKSLNDQKTGINNLDLNLDTKVDFIKVVTKQKDKDFTFILQVDVAEKETQDVAVILVSKDTNDKVTMQIVGDQDLYGKDYVIEPKPAAPPVTPNPAYTGTAPATVTIPATTTTTVIVVESAPVVQYVYSPAYVPYVPPYYYAYYPPYYAAFTVMAVSTYHHNCYPYHGGYHGGGYGNTVVIHNENNYNNYNNSRNSSNTVNNNRNNGNYNNNNASARPSNGSSAPNRASTSPSTNQSKGSSSSSARQSTSPSASPSKSSSASQKSSSSRSSGGGGSRAGGGRRR